MTVVVDASVLVTAVVDCGPAGRWAETILEMSSLCAPALALAEATNILRRLEAAEELTRLEATAARTDILRLDLELFPFEPVADRVWELRHNLTSYDAWYVAIAESVGAPLATLDARLRRAAGPTCRFLEPAP